jgi:hypothetical protein
VDEQKACSPVKHPFPLKLLLETWQPTGPTADLSDSACSLLDHPNFVTNAVTSAALVFQIKQLQRKGHHPPPRPGYATIQPEDFSHLLFMRP